MPYYNFSFEITHLCNKYCSNCSHRIKHSDYKYLTIDEYEKIRLTIQHLAIIEIRIIGGEPLMHPQFKELMNRIFNDFDSSRIVLITNGKLLPQLDKRERNRFDRIYITWYKGFNDEEIKEVIGEKNIFINREDFINIDDSRKLNVTEAKYLFNHCPQKMYRFIGTRLYICCNEESIERMVVKHKIHVDISEDDHWQRTIDSISHYEACQYCIVADSISNRKRMRGYFDLMKQKILLYSPLAKYDLNVVWQIWRHIKNRRNWHRFQNGLNAPC